jgi:hypothetical protein
MKWGIVAVAVAAAFALPASAENRNAVFDPRALGAFEGPPTQVLVLGSAHLSGAPETFDRRHLDPLLAKLSGFKPSVVAVEFLSGESLDALERYASVYPEVADTYGKSAREAIAAAQPALNLTTPQAEAEARKLLAALTETPLPAERRRLAAVLCAAGEYSSATVQWLQLPPKERAALDSVTPALVLLLNKWAASRNEALSVGAALAARLRLKQVYAVDDHSADDIVLRIAAPLQAAIDNDPAVKDVFGALKDAGLLDVTQRMISGQATLDAFRFLNDPRTGAIDASIQWGYFLRSKAPGLLGRQRLAEWEARNLRMTANLREAFAHHPGERVLFIVGAAHKPYIEAYLDRMHDVEIVDALAVLK